MIRRLHQIHIALFVEECASVDITPVQYTLLSIIKQEGEAEQTRLTVAAAMDRTNISDVVLRLARRGLVAVRVNPAHRRKRLVRITAQGLALLRRVNPKVARVHERTIGGLNATDRKLFLGTLRSLVELQNDLGRAPLRMT